MNMHKGQWNQENSPDVSIYLENLIVDISQQALMVNSNNKQCYFKLLVRSLSYNDHNVLQCCSNSDTSIVSTALNIACAREKICPIAADRYLEIMLIYMWNHMMKQIKIKSGSTRKYKIGSVILGRLEIL